MVTEQQQNDTQPLPPRSDAEADRELSRRDFLSVAWGLAGGLALASSGYVGLRFLGSRMTDGLFGEVMTTDFVDNIPLNSVISYPAGQFFLVRNDAGGFLALYRKCTHLDCVVTWNEDQNRFNCPCHGSQFTRNGDVLNLPAPRPLVRFGIEISRGQVLVDTGNLIERTRVSDSDWTYPPEEPAP